MKSVFLILNVYFTFYMSLLCPLYGSISPGSYELCKNEIDAIPIEKFSTENIIKASKNLKTALIQIKDGKLFVEGRFIDESFISKIKSSAQGSNKKELMLTMYKLVTSRKLPNVTFLYNKHCYDNSINNLMQENTPVFVGVNSFIYKNSPLITFVSSYPLARSFMGEEHKNGSLENVFLETLDSHDKIHWQSKSPKIFWRGGLSDVSGWSEVLSRRKILNTLSSPPVYCTPREYLSILSLYDPQIIDSALTYFPFKKAKILRDVHCKQSATILEHIQHKYQIVLDGIHCTTPGYMWRLLSDCCVLKVESIVYNWFYVNLIPWVHFVPVSADLHDLYDVYSYLETHQDLAEQIAKNGREFALNYLKPDDYLDFCVMCLELYAEKQIKANLLKLDEK